MRSSRTAQVATLGLNRADIKIMLSSHAHFDHIEGHAVVRRLTGAQVMAMAGDAERSEAARAIPRLAQSAGSRSRWIASEARRHGVAWRNDAARAAHPRPPRARRPGSPPSKTTAVSKRWGSLAAPPRTAACRC